MNWISAGSGIGMNYRFSQSGRTERNRQDHLYPENLFPFANVPTTDPFTGKTDSRYAKCQTTNDVPARRRDLLGQRVLGQDGVAAAHDAGRRDRSSGIAVTAATTSCRACSTAPAAAASQGKLPAVPESAELEPGAARAVPRARQVVDVRESRRRHSRVPRLDNGTMTLPANTGFPTNIPDPFHADPERQGDLHRPQDDALSLQSRSGLLHTRHPDASSRR